jgi:hypothetical protein
MHASGLASTRSLKRPLSSANIAVMTFVVLAGGNLLIRSCDASGVRVDDDCRSVTRGAPRLRPMPAAVLTTAVIDHSPTTVCIDALHYSQVQG